MFLLSDVFCKNLRATLIFVLGLGWGGGGALASGSCDLCGVIVTQRPGNSKPDSSVDLRGAQLHWATELSSKKNVFRVRGTGKEEGW